MSTHTIEESKKLNPIWINSIKSPFNSSNWHPKRSFWGISSSHLTSTVTDYKISYSIKTILRYILRQTTQARATCYPVSGALCCSLTAILGQWEPGIIGWRNRLYCRVRQLSKGLNGCRYRADLMMKKNASQAIIRSHWQMLPRCISDLSSIKDVHISSFTIGSWERRQLTKYIFLELIADTKTVPQILEWSSAGCEWQLIKFLIGSLTIQQDQIVGNKLGRHRKTVSLDSHVRIGWPSRCELTYKYYRQYEASFYST